MDIYNVGNRVMNTYIYRALEGCIMIDTGYEHSLKSVEKKRINRAYWRTQVFQKRELNI